MPRWNAPSERPLKPTIESPDYVPPGLEGIERLAWIMDRALKIPGTPIRVGLDAILGLLPVGGDLLTGTIQAGIVLVAMGKYKVPKAVAARMAANVLLDIAVGSIPVVGDAFDVFFKANTKNLKLLGDVQRQRAARQPVATGSSVGFLVLLGLLMFGTLALVLVGMATILLWLFRRPLI